jgi:predicted esterase
MTSSRFSRSFGLPESNREHEEPSEPLVRSDDSRTSSAEVILSSENGAAQGVCSRTRVRLRPSGVFVPENYEQNYAYPLIVWLHEAGRSERDIVNVLPQISMRNYLGLALRGTAKAHPRTQADGSVSQGFRWSRSERVKIAFQDELHASVRHLRQDYHVNSERIFLAGAGDGATLAWDLFLARPEWFAGLAVFGGRFPWRRRPSAAISRAARETRFSGGRRVRSRRVEQGRDDRLATLLGGIGSRRALPRPQRAVAAIAVSPHRSLDHARHRRLLVRRRASRRLCYAFGFGVQFFVDFDVSPEHLAGIEAQAA